MCLVANLCPDPVGELTALPQTPCCIKGEGAEVGRGWEVGRGGMRRGGEKKGGKEIGDDP